MSDGVVNKSGNRVTYYLGMLYSKRGGCIDSVE